MVATFCDDSDFTSKITYEMVRLKPADFNTLRSHRSVSLYMSFTFTEDFVQVP